MPKPEPLTTEMKFAALADSLEWFIPCLLGRGVEGQLCRRAAVDYLRKQQQGDADAGVDLVGRTMLTITLQRYDANPEADVPMTADMVMRLFRSLQPTEVAALVDASVPPVELEKRGSACDALNELLAEHVTGSPGEDMFDRLDEDEVHEAAMPFSEGAAPVRPLRAKHLSPADAQRVAREGLRNSGYSADGNLRKRRLPHPASFDDIHY